MSAERQNDNGKDKHKRGEGVDVRADTGLDVGVDVEWEGVGAWAGGEVGDNNVV